MKNWRVLASISALLLAMFNASPAMAATQVTGVVDYAQAKPGQVVRLTGMDLQSVQKVLVDGVETSFSAKTDSQIAIRIPTGTSPGDARLALVSSTGEITEFSLEIIATEVAPRTKVTIGTFLGFIAVYTKNLAGHKLSIELRNRSRSDLLLDKDFTSNLTKTKRNQLVDVKVFIDSKLLQSGRILVR
jgi:hypothetical protein